MSDDIGPFTRAAAAFELVGQATRPGEFRMVGMPFRLPVAPPAANEDRLLWADRGGPNLDRGYTMV